MESYVAIGVMSGTSLDGLDLVACRFMKDETWQFEVLKAGTISYSHEWVSKLASAHKLNALEFTLLNNDFGQFIGKNVAMFCSDIPQKPDLISSHGHTIFHQPSKKLTSQIGNGAVIAASSGIKTVCDFRTLDIALGGQGAPLVPIGDELLFADFDFCLNLGGIANISYNENGNRVAFDICPANMAVNLLAKKLGYEYDLDGNLGRMGEVNQELLSLLNNLDFYKTTGPKSIGREWFESNFSGIVNSFNLSPTDAIRTVYEHISDQVCLSVDKYSKGQMLVTGGGAHNIFLVELLSEKNKHKTVLPSKEIIDFKEAIIFAFLGILRAREETNCLKSVTGSAKDNSGGAIYLP